MREAIIHCDGSPEMTRNLAGLLSNDLPALTEPAVTFVLECVEELPVKTPVYVALVGLLNLASPTFVEELVTRAVDRLESRLASSAARDDQIRCKLLVRFMTMLPSVNVIRPSAAIDVQDALLCAAGDAADIAAAGAARRDPESNSNSNANANANANAYAWQPRCDFLVKCALAATPWCGASLASAREPGAADAFDALFRAAEEYLVKRSPRGPDPSSMTFSAGAVDAATAAAEADDWLEELFGRVNETRRAGRVHPEAWTTGSVPALVSAFEEFDPSAADANGGRAAETHAPPPMKVPLCAFESVAEALAAFPARPRLRYTRFPVPFLRFFFFFLNFFFEFFFFFR